MRITHQLTQFLQLVLSLLILTQFSELPHSLGLRHHMKGALQAIELTVDLQDLGGGRTISKQDFLLERNTKNLLNFLSGVDTFVKMSLEKLCHLTEGLVSSSLLELKDGGHINGIGKSQSLSDHLDSQTTLHNTKVVALGSSHCLRSLIVAVANHKHTTLRQLNRVSTKGVELDVTSLTTDTQAGNSLVHTTTHGTDVAPKE